MVIADHVRTTEFQSGMIRGGLQDSYVGGLVNRQGPSWRVVFVRSGGIIVRSHGQDHRVPAPVLAWQPTTPEMRLMVRAGSLGAHLLVGEQGISNAIGRKPEAAELRMMASRPVQMSLQNNEQTEEEIARAFDVILRENRDLLPGSETIVEAQVRMLLVYLWRYVTKDHQMVYSQATRSQILPQFRQLLEVHFRERWGVKDYAKALGISPDRLHDLCSRTLKKSPLRLIHERTMFEAQSLLTRSNQTTDQISDFLGFRSQGQFSKFFKSFAGMPPGAFRRTMLRQPQSNNDDKGFSFADWP